MFRAIKRLIKATILSNKPQVLGVKKVPFNSSMQLNEKKITLMLLFS
jgi:hypothetical protein